MIPQEMVLEDGRKIFLVHYIFLAPKGTTSVAGQPATASKDTWKVACSPSVEELSSAGNRGVPYQRSEDPRAVNCPLCMKTELFKRHLAEIQRR
jgi:hypothetical protein